MNTAYNWDAKYKDATVAHVFYALRDLAETLEIWRDEPETDYTRKLWSEWDYLVTLKSKKVH